MQPVKADIISRLRGEILLRQGLQKTPGLIDLDIGLGRICQAFPDHTFPLAAIHEFCSANTEDGAATTGFISGILSTLMQNDGVTLWLGSARSLFPPALKTFGIDPAKIIFIDLAKEKDILWAMEEALKCSGLATVVGEIKNLDFTLSRRLQLAVEQSKVTGFVIRHSDKLATTACVTRWKISSLNSELIEDMPGIGFPRWNVELLKVRNGKPGAWQLEWADGKFNHITPAMDVHLEEHKIAG